MCAWQGGTQLLVLMEFMDLGSLDSVRHKLNGALPESLLGKVAFCVLSISIRNI